MARVTLPSGDEAVLLTRYDDVRQVLSDPPFAAVPDSEGAARIADDGTCPSGNSPAPASPC
ncbi:hypothetical protein [Streptomyces sp. NPDC001536]|uniref:hypothetical protein n=1 Tax=Streptomyces sp. NPDC001536 TaxID=3364583 RepID=UPI0036A29A7E